MTVYVVQKQMRFDRESGSLVPKFDLEPAEEYGAIEYLLSPTAAPFNPGPILAELRERLARFNDEDYLLLVGNPVIIGWAMAIAADINGNVKALQWSGKDQRYICIDAEVLPVEGS